MISEATLGVVLPYIEKFGEEALKNLLSKVTGAGTKPGDPEMAEAGALVNGDRQADYGSPATNYTGIAKVWSGLLSRKLAADITPEEAALMMVGLKIQRQCMKPKRDNMVDAHGYLLVAAHCRVEANDAGR